MFPKKSKDSFSVKYDLPKSIADLAIDYLFKTDGSLKIMYHFKPVKKNLPKIPRIGLSVFLPDSYQNVAWYGRGSHETQGERKTSVKIGRW